MGKIHKLDAKGRCCGRKPMVYKRPQHYLFCDRCCSAFAPSGVQIANWAYEPDGEGFRPTANRGPLARMNASISLKSPQRSDEEPQRGDTVSPPDQQQPDTKSATPLRATA